METRSASIIHDLIGWAPPAQVITSERGEQFRRTGHCRICGDQECWTPEECAEEARSSSELVAGPGVPRAGGTHERAAGGPGLAADPGAGPGLVICAKTGRVRNDTASEQALWRPAFPSADLIGWAADELPKRDKWDGHEGPRPRIMIGPGCITISRPDLARRERAHERAFERHCKEVDLLAAYLNEYGEFPDEGRGSRREIVGWSAKSRANFVHVMCELDYAPMFADPSRVAAMVTLTYPSDWLTVAPDGKTVKEHLKTFRKRYERAWGEPLRAVWKLEFQRRGAPHFHILLVPPHGLAGTVRQEGKRRRRAAVGDGLPFRQWLSVVWADIVAHPDPVERMKHETAGTGVDFAEGLRASDPKRVAVYFLKHGGATAKEYQHIVPEAWREPGKGPGRFWGYWGLERVTAGREVDPATAVQAVRILRRWSRAQGVTRQVSVERVDIKTGRVRIRRVRRPVRRLRVGAGWVAVNDGAAFGIQLARALAVIGAAAPAPSRLPSTHTP